MTTVQRSIDATLDRVDQMVVANLRASSSMVERVEAAAIPLDALRRWAIQKYHQTYQQVRGFSAIHSATTHPAIREFQVEQIVSEETPFADGPSSHHEMMGRFAVACGATDHDLEPATMAAPVADFVEFRVRLCSTDPLMGVLAFYVQESHTPDGAGRLAAAFRRSYGFTDTDLEWFDVHAEADVEHAAVARGLLASAAAADTTFCERAIDVAADTCRRWVTLQQFYASLLDREASMC